MERIVQAQFQMLDSFVNEIHINIENKIESNKDLNLKGRIGFRIVNKTKEDKKYIGQIQLINDIKLIYENEEIGDIHISMIGTFSGDSELEEEKFVEMLKYNGAPALSQLIRAYVYSATSLGGNSPIITPMINFVKFFEEIENEKNEKK